jgi:hypothetical protein
VTSDPQSSPLAAANLFYSGALRRIAVLIGIFTASGLLLSAVLFPKVSAAGFATGALLSWLNFYLLERSVIALGSRIVNQQSGERGGVIIVGFLIRYVLIGIAAYVIFRSSVQGLYGFLAGLVLPIAAASCEAAYELYVALRRGL